MALQPRRPLEELLHVGFNQDGSLLAAGFASADGGGSFRVFNTEPLEPAARRDFPAPGGVGAAELLFRTNLAALVGGGASPRWSPNRVNVFDNAAGRAVGELKYPTPVRAVRLRRDAVAVALDRRALLYALDDLRQLLAVETAPNAGGLLALSAGAAAVLACPGPAPGEARLEALDPRRSRVLRAHRAPLAALALSADGGALATASEAGTLVRVWATADGAPLRELRRGADPARVFSLALSREPGAPLWAAATSDKGTAHVWSLAAPAGPDNGGDGDGGDGGGDERSAPGAPPGGGGALSLGLAALRAGGRLLPRGVRGRLAAAYAVHAQRSHAQFQLPDRSRCVAAFGRAPCTLLLAASTGALHRIGWASERAGAAELLASALFVDPGEGGAPRAGRG